MVIMLLWMTFIILMDFIFYYKQTTSKGYAMWTINLCFGVRYIVDLQGMIAVVKWACTVLVVHEGVAALNQHLLCLRYGSELSILTGEVSVKKAETLIQRLALSYERMSNMMRQMNEANGLFLIVMLLSTFLRLVITPYYMLFLHEVYGTIFSINWILVHLAVLALTIEPCHWTHTQVIIFR
ncbi:uncharacterized protein LOC133529053 [Cydia pomonella]|uniref:uncharacterized protein LOC133529053 n=1 Tax=Cydia pomonella TaxID=82600 RepID=UPI002ADD334B|nr:uncharacterized protein LOC133529053 [Cydia pomonella]